MSEGHLTRARAASQPNATLQTSTSTDDLTFKIGSGKKGKNSSAKKKKKMATPNSERNPEEVIVADYKIPQFTKPGNKEQWFALFQQLNQTLVQLATDVSKSKTITGNFTSFTPEWKKETDSNIDQLHDKCLEHEHQIKLLSNMVIKQDEKIKSLETKLNGVLQRESKANLVVFGIDEVLDETKESLIQNAQNFFKNEMEIEEDITVIDAY